MHTYLAAFLSTWKLRTCMHTYASKHMHANTNNIHKWTHKAYRYCVYAYRLLWLSASVMERHFLPQWAVFDVETHKQSNFKNKQLVPQHSDPMVSHKWNTTIRYLFYPRREQSRRGHRKNVKAPWPREGESL